MPDSPFLFPDSPIDPVPSIQQIAEAVLRTSRQAFAAQKECYLRAQSLIWANKYFSGEEIIAEIGEENAAKLQLGAILAKTTINYVVPGTINDTVPEATITLPG